MRDRTIWIIAAVVALACAVEAIFVPHKRGALIEAALCMPIVAWAVIDLRRRPRRRRELRERAALVSAQVAAMSRDDVPADVLALVAADKKIEAIRRFRELTGAGLKESKDFIDAL